ncbi:MAG: wax ester/triacylglycerol synthase family O-acyltransferase [Chrysiogenetes bacterium]|nr:wax ester/triacylglycerol synthase family O-acyltransferase [Chrysiogenetes bacterium]
MASRVLTPSDAMFLYGESRETMMHVASLLIFSRPEDAAPDYLREVLDEIRDCCDVQPPWNLKLKTPDFLMNPRHVWEEQDEVDLDYHVRRSALPSPGDERELGILVSRLHGHSIDFHRPPWEVHLIEGLENDRFALFFKIHHSLMDGFTGSKTLARSLSTTPEDVEKPVFFMLPEPERPAGEAKQRGGWREVLRAQWETARQVGSELLEVAQGKDPDLVLPYQAPKCILNGRIGRNRRFATQQYGLDRLKAIAKKSETTLNDVVMALSAASLRRFLMELGELPGDPLIVMMPVNVRPKDDPGGGNAVGAILASLATDIADPAERLQAIHDSSCHAKAQLQGMSKDAILQYTTLTMLPFGLQQVTGLSGRTRPAFNVVISNVPGPDHPLYFRGAKLEANYPVSIPIHGQALNITCVSYNGTLNFGFTGCRDTLPSMQRLAVYTGEALEELEAALGM